MNDLPACALYNAEYYSSHCGSVSYERNDFWLGMFGKVADQLVRSFGPRRVFDAGCAMGMLVESFWDRGCEAYGRDISEFAIAQVRPDMRPYCTVGSISTSFDGTFDLITCIEVVEHMDSEQALAALAAIANATDRVVFSSSPNDFAEVTHINVQPTIYWLHRWAELGFAPSVMHDAGYLAPHAYVLERREAGRSDEDLLGFADRIRHRVALAEIGSRAASLASELGSTRLERDAARATAEASVRQLAERQTALEQSRGDRAALQVVLEQSRVDAGSLRSELAAATQLVTALQSESVNVRARLKAAQGDLTSAAARLDAAAREAGDAQASAESLRAELSNANTHLAATTAHLRAVEQDAAVKLHAAHMQREDVEQALFAAVTERNALLRSTIWRMSAPIRAAMKAIPRPLRRGARTSMRYFWAAARLQLGPFHAARRAEHAAAAKVAASPLFDAAWYVATYPNAVAQGMSPALHYVVSGEAAGLLPSLGFSPARYLVLHPEATYERPLLLHAERHNQEAHGRQITPPPAAPATLPAPAAAASAVQAGPDATRPAGPPQVAVMLDERFRELRPLQTFAAPHSADRLTIVTDSISTGSLYGGVGTALLVAALTAKRLGAGLRLVTRTEPADPSVIGRVLAIHGIEWDGNIDVVHAPWDGTGFAVPSSDRDVFMTTSWWTTWATRQSVPRARICYLLQEDERMFYPHGDDHLRASETMRDPGIAYIVNSNLLLQHLHSEGLAPGGVAFEPSFPVASYHAPDFVPDFVPDFAPDFLPDENTTSERQAAGGNRVKRNLFFYARPINARNLYWRGLEALSAAIEQGILRADEWNFHFAGKGAPDMRLPGGVSPILLENLSWDDYTKTIRTMDLGLSLMYTPHTSYPPLDLAASGAVVVTNRFPPKTSLDQLCANILCVDPDVKSLVAGLAEGVRLAKDAPRRRANYDAATLARDWATSAAPAVDRMAQLSAGLAR